MHTILQLKGNYVRAGGPETLIASLAQAINARRFRSITVLLRRPDMPVAEAFAPLRAGDAWREIPWRGLSAVFSSAAVLRRLSRGLRADVLHSHDMRANLVAYLSTRFQRLPWIAHVHGWLGSTHAGRWRVYERIDRLLIRHADLVLTGSRAALDEVRAAGARQARVVTNSVRLPDIAAALRRGQSVRAALGISPETVVVGVIGRVHPGKGQRVFVEAMRQCEPTPRLHGLIVGEGPDLASLRAEVANVPTPHPVSFVGFQEDGTAHLAAMDICLVPSLKESLPLACLEAMALSRAVIASQVGDMPEAIEDGVSGILAPPGDVAALAAALRRLAGDPDYRRRLGEAARARVESRFSAASMARELESIYAELIEATKLHG